MSRFSGQILLVCKECGGRMVLTGTDEDRRSESAAFECRCEGGPLLTDRVRDGSLSERVAGAPAATQSFAGKLCCCPR
jgi:hypothetical protein